MADMWNMGGSAASGVLGRINTVGRSIGAYAGEAAGGIGMTGQMVGSGAMAGARGLPGRIGGLPGMAGVGRAGRFVGAHPRTFGGGAVLAAGAVGLSSGAHRLRQRRDQGYLF